MRILFGAMMLNTLTGCDQDAFQSAKSFIAEYDYASAVELLRGPDAVKARSSEVTLALAKCLLVEGDHAEAYALIDSTLKQAPDLKADFAKACLEAAAVIVREKNRARETLMILDSALALNPTLKQDAVDLAWTRALEYLAAKGSAGLTLMRWVTKQDEQMEGRLRAFNAPLSKRYHELNFVDRVLNGAAANLPRNGGFNPPPVESFSQLFERVPAAWFDTSRNGWNFKLNAASNRLQIVAQASPNNPYGIPWGTELTAP